MYVYLQGPVTIILDSNKLGILTLHLMYIHTSTVIFIGIREKINTPFHILHY